MNRLLTLAACAALLGTGCVSTARYVETRHGSGGVVAIPANTNSWPGYHRDAAKQLMDQACPNGYTITEEKEEAVGERSKEYRIAFRSAVQVPEALAPSHVPTAPPPPAPPGLPSRPVPIG